MRFIYIGGNYIDADKVSFIGNLEEKNYIYGVEIILEGIKIFLEFNSSTHTTNDKYKAEKVREKMIDLIIPRHLEF